MRLSEKRINALAKTIAAKMKTNGSFQKSGSQMDLSSLISQTMIQYFSQEEEIDLEVRQLLAKQKNLPPEGTGEYQAAFQQEKIKLANKKGYPL
ncbi:MAG: DUF507 family protein [Sumerlaeia bacterium]